MYNNRVMEVALLQAETYQGNMYRVAMGGYEMDHVFLVEGML